MLGSSSPRLLGDIVNSLKKKLKSKSEIKWHRKKEGFYLDISNAIKKFDFTPLTTSQTINKYIKNYLKIN